jgi:hypothetical protein
MSVIWNDLSPDQWLEENKDRWRDFVDGRIVLEIPKGFVKTEMEFGTFIQVSPNNLLREEPGVHVRETFYGGAMKVLCPADIKAGDKIESQSGKSLIARRVHTV